MRLGLPERGAVLLDQRPAEAQQRPHISRFSSREIVDCEHNSSSEGNRSSASLNNGSRRSVLGVVAVLVPGGNHQQAEPDDLRQAMHDLGRRPRVLQTAGQAIGQSQPPLDLAQERRIASEDGEAIKAGDHSLAPNR